MAEAVVLGMIQDLESLHITCTEVYEHEIIEKKIKELKEMLDLLRESKMEERSSLKYLLADLVELAQDFMDLNIETLEYRRANQVHIFNDLRARSMLLKLKSEIKMNKKNIGDEEEEEEVVVGLEKDVKKLRDKVILTNFEDSQIIFIKGMIGIGKTTLARQLYKEIGIGKKTLARQGYRAIGIRKTTLARRVYKDEASQFHRHAWVSISSDTSHKEILIKLIQQLVEGYERDPSLEEMDNRSLRLMLHQHLQGLSYFIVLDNIHEEVELRYFLMNCLPSEGRSGSRLLLTSRYEFQGIRVEYTHDMKALDSDKSWQLFLKTVDKITGVENRFSKDLEKKGREMLKKCWGLPLAIIDVARQKAKQRLSGIEWEELFESIDLSNTLKLLEPMYHQLEEDIKTQFLHLSLSKENAIMREEKLEQIWAANGLDIEEVASGLASRSILELVKRNFQKRKYHLNPLLHMVSIKKAEEEIGLEILRSNGNSRPSQNARHRVVHCGRDKLNHFTNDNGKQLISLVFHGGGGYLDNASSSYWESFESLKILDMEDFGVKTLSETIGALIELRYLGLRNNYIQEIPHSLAHLENLEVLDIALNFMVVVPDFIWLMGNLRELHMSNVIFRKPLKVDALQHLRTLAYISIYDWAYEDLGFKTMDDFRTLGIEEVDENSDIGKLSATLAKIRKLRYLFLRGFRFRSMPCLDEIGVTQKITVLKLDGRIGSLPSADNLPKFITYIALVNTCLDEDPMPILEKLNYLRHLKLRNAYTGREMVIQHGGFHMLEVLCINELWNLRKIQVDDYSMSGVCKIEINSCPRLETLPEQIQSMTELQVFKMVTTKHIATMIRNSGLTSEIFEVDIYP